MNVAEQPVPRMRRKGGLATRRLVSGCARRCPARRIGQGALKPQNVCGRRLQRQFDFLVELGARLRPLLEPSIQHDAVNDCRGDDRARQ
jgi:hypothetical protein